MPEWVASDAIGASQAEQRASIMSSLPRIKPTNGAHTGDAPDEEFNPPAHSRVDQARIRRAVREILIAVGEDPDREGLVETPDRVARMYAEVFQGLHQDPSLVVKKLFSQEYDEMVVLPNIRFESFCEHHLLPFTGRVHVAYLPQGRVVGLSKIPRLIDILARRPQVQERLTVQIAELLETELAAAGVGVVVEANHTCMSLRGVRKADSTCVTSAMLGAFRDRPATRAEFLSLIQRGDS